MSVVKGERRAMKLQKTLAECFDCDNKMICRDKVYDDLLKQFEEKEEK